jgi:guanylate kinase
LAKAGRELEQREAFDVVIVNENAERAADEVAAIIDASPQVDGLPEGPPGDSAKGRKGSSNP